MIPEPASLRGATLAVVRAAADGVMDLAPGQAPAAAAPLKTAILLVAILLVAAKVVAAATMAGVHAPPTLVSHGRTQATALATEPRHAASAVHKPHVLRVTNNNANRARKCSARTHAAPVLIWASSATTLTIASPPVMCQQASHPPACLRAALAVAAGAAIAVAAVVVVVAATSAAAARAQVAAVAGVIQAAGFGANRPKGQISIKKAALGCFLLFVAVV